MVQKKMIIYCRPSSATKLPLTGIVESAWQYIGCWTEVVPELHYSVIDNASTAIGCTLGVYLGIPTR